MKLYDVFVLTVVYLGIRNLFFVRLRLPYKWIGDQSICHGKQPESFDRGINTSYYPPVREEFPCGKPTLQYFNCFLLKMAKKSE